MDLPRFHVTLEYQGGILPCNICFNIVSRTEAICNGMAEGMIQEVEIRRLLDEVSREGQVPAVLEGCVTLSAGSTEPRHG